jgi:tetratricopeptide (TPR) repeat protein
MTDDDRGGTLESARPGAGLLLQEAGDGPDSLLAALSRARSELDRERAAAPALAAELLALPPGSREERLRRDSRFHTWGLCELLLTRSLEAPEPATAAELALLALAGADRLDPERHPAPVVGDLKARAWAAAGEARRKQGDLTGAEEALRAAAAGLARGTGDLLVEARLLEFEAAVRRTQGRPGEAAALLKQAAARYRQSGETQHLERVLADREAVLREGGQHRPG